MTWLAIGVVTAPTVVDGESASQQLLPPYEFTWADDAEGRRDGRYRKTDARSWLRRF